jgi:arginine decarboxylase
VSESGRAIVAQHSVLIVETFGAIEKASRQEAPALTAGGEIPLLADILEIRQQSESAEPLSKICTTRRKSGSAPSRCSTSDSSTSGQKRISKPFIRQIAANIVELFRDAEHIPEEVRVIEIAIGDQYLCNFSVFQSLLDHWALGQLFP